MHITRELFQIDAAWYALDYDVPRSLGCHISDVIQYMGKQYPQPATPEAVAAQQAQFLGGFLWERCMARMAIETECQRNPRLLRKVEQLMWCYQCNKVIWGKQRAEAHCKTRNHVGIFLTPDAVLIANWLLKEWKFTTRSMRSAGGDLYVPLPQHPGDEPEAEAELKAYEHISAGIPEWIWQIKSYCHVLGDLVGSCLEALLEVCFVHGDYGVTTREGVTARYRISFRQRDLTEHWSMMVDNALDGGLLNAA